MSDSPDRFSDDIAITALKNRYNDAYFVAKTIVMFGKTIKTIGIVIGAVIFVGLFFFAPLGIALFIGGPSALFLGLVSYVLGVLVSAQGQILTASLDGAVNCSPFLTNEHRSEIMSLGNSKGKDRGKTRKSCEICGKELGWNSLGTLRCTEHVYTKKQ